MMAIGRNSAWLACALMVMAGAMSAQAETVRIRAGEHEGFTRLVLELKQRTAWQLGRNDTGYELRLDRPEVEFDTSKIFSRIPRTRLTDVVQLDLHGALGLAVTCDCHADAFETAAGQIVIDMKSGPAEARSAFERPIAVPSEIKSPQTAVEPLPHSDQGESGQGDSGQVVDNKAGGYAATITFRPTQNQDASLPIYWRSFAADPAGASEPERPAPDVLSPADAGSGQAALMPTRDVVDGSFSKPLVSTPAEDPGAGPPKSLPFSAIDNAPPLPRPVLPPPIAAANVTAVETALLRQLSRAASQGLVKLDTDVAAQLGAVDDDNTQSKLVSEKAMPLDVSGTDGADKASDHIAFHAETSMDRDGAATHNERHLTADGITCLSDDAVNLTTWGDDRPAVLQLTEARSQLVGEFDRPDAAAVEVLARLYLFLGMGAEARQTLVAFGVEIDGAATLADLGMILDDQPVDAKSVLHGMRDCGGAVALWAFLAAPTDNDGKFVDQPAVVRGFSGLPGPVRELLGRRVSHRLIAIGALDSATAVRNAIARRPQSPGRIVGMIDAEIDLDKGKADKAEAVLDKLGEGNDALSSNAVMVAIQSRLERGEEIDPKQIETVAALAFEHKSGPDGPRFAHLEVIARAVSGDVPGAFESYAIWKRRSPLADRNETARELSMLLASKSSDADFMELYFGRAEALAEAGSDPELTLALAYRLSSLGFAEEVRSILQGEIGETEMGRMLLTRAALDLFEPDVALRHVAGLSGTEAETLRARAYSMQDKHISAAAALQRAGATEAAGDAAWAAGDWAQATNASAPFQQAVSRLKLTEEPRPSIVEAPASLEGSKAVLDDSAALRDTLMELLGAP